MRDGGLIAIASGGRQISQIPIMTRMGIETCGVDRRKRYRSPDARGVGYAGHYMRIHRLRLPKNGWEQADEQKR